MINQELEAPSLPHNLQIEYAILGWVASDNRIMHHLAFLEPRHFYSGPHADIFAAMRKLHDARRANHSVQHRPRS